MSKKNIVSPSDPIKKAALSIIGVHSYRLRSNTETALRKDSPEALHNIRVSMRRLRLALRLFSQFLNTKQCDCTRKDMKSFMRKLGDIRNFDVFSIRLQKYMTKNKDMSDKARYKIMAVLKSKQVPQRAELHRILISQRYIAMLDSLIHIEGPKSETINDKKSGYSALNVSRDLITESVKDIARHRKKEQDKLTYTDLHEIRVAFKKLRYICEFFSGIYGKKIIKFTRLCIEFQDVLGERRDTEFSIKYLENTFKVMRKMNVDSIIEQERRKEKLLCKKFRYLWKKFPKNTRKIKKLIF